MLQFQMEHMEEQTRQARKQTFLLEEIVWTVVSLPIRPQTPSNPMPGSIAMPRTALHPCRVSHAPMPFFEIWWDLLPRGQPHVWSSQLWQAGWDVSALPV